MREGFKKKVTLALKKAEEIQCVGDEAAGKGRFRQRKRKGRGRVGWMCAGLSAEQLGAGCASRKGGEEVSRGLPLPG